MANRPMNDEEVMNEMSKMVAFIKQEAREKAREIRVKADEEFAIEKAKLVKSEQAAIDGTYEKKLKGAQVAQKIEQSNLTNKSRLKLLHAREEHLQDLFSTAREHLMAIVNNESQYAQFLEGIILQGMLQIMEPSVTVIARPQDVALVQDATGRARETYKSMSSMDVQADVEGSLGGNVSGGVKLISGSRRITLNNTLDERLRLLEDRMLPEIRTELFGRNENRKFYT